MERISMTEDHPSESDEKTDSRDPSKVGSQPHVPQLEFNFDVSMVQDRHQIAVRMISLMREWQAEIRSKGQDSVAAKRLYEVFWISATDGRLLIPWKPWFQSPSWNYFKSKHWKMANCVEDLDEVLSQAKPHTSWKTSDGKDFPWMESYEAALGSLGKAIKEADQASYIRNMSGENDGNVWESSPELLGMAKKLYPKFSDNIMHRSRRDNQFNSRPAIGPGKSKFEVEMGSFFRWLIQTMRKE